MKIPSLSNESSALDGPRFHLKLRNGLFERDLRPIFVPDVGVDGNVADKRAVSVPAEFFLLVFNFHMIHSSCKLIFIIFDFFLLNDTLNVCEVMQKTRIIRQSQKYKKKNFSNDKNSNEITLN